MSFDLFIQCFANGEPYGVPVADVQAAFGPHLETREPQQWKVFYDDQHWSDVLVSFLTSDPGRVSAMSVHRPCDDSRLWDALVSLLKLGHLVLYYPAECPPLLTADKSVAQHLPNDMLASMGRIILVNRGEDIRDEIQRA